MDQQRPHQVTTPVVNFRFVQANVVQTGERKDRTPDLLVADMPEGALIALHGVKRALVYVPGVSYESLLENTREVARLALLAAESEEVARGEED